MCCSNSPNRLCISVFAPLFCMYGLDFILEVIGSMLFPFLVGSVPSVDEVRRNPGLAVSGECLLVRDEALYSTEQCCLEASP